MYICICIAGALSQGQGPCERGPHKSLVFIRPRNLAVHERTSIHFLVLPGSLLSITEITEYRYFSPSKPIRELKYTSEQNIVPMDLIIEPILFL